MIRVTENFKQISGEFFTGLWFGSHWGHSKQTLFMILHVPAANNGIKLLPPHLAQQFTLNRTPLLPYLVTDCHFFNKSILLEKRTLLARENNALTLWRPGGHRCLLSPKFQFHFKKRSSKKKCPMNVVPISR